MLTKEENERLTRVGPGTPMGETLRRYWLPAGLSDELPEPDGAPLRVRILCEDLIAFRDTSGKIGLVSAYCPHRRAPIFFGRNEENGIRCVYHGWKFDRTGACVDMPSEPPDTLFKNKVKIESYPVHEAGGFFWTYMGPQDQMPPPPDYELLRAPATHRHVSKTYEEANFVQALEGGLDTAHSSFLHNMAVGDTTYLRNADTAPRLELEKTDYGFCYAGLRSAGENDYVRVYHYVMPAQQLRGGVTADQGRGFRPVPALHGHIWVPMDDENTWTFNWIYSYDPKIPITHDHAIKYESRVGRGPEHMLPGYHLKANKRNDYFIDRQVQKTQTYTGIAGINTQDIALQEGMGPIVDRSREHLGTTDRAIIATRQLLLEATYAVEAGNAPRGADSATYRDIRPVDRLVPKEQPWRESLREELVAKF